MRASGQYGELFVSTYYYCFLTKEGLIYITLTNNILQSEDRICCVRANKLTDQGVHGHLYPNVHVHIVPKTSMGKLTVFERC